MKMSFHYSKILLLCIASIFLLPSCSKYLINDGTTKIEKKVFIRITGVVPGTSNLIMVDENGNSADTFHAYSGQKVIWEIEDKAEIKAFKGFPAKTEFKDVDLHVYRKRPGKRFLSKKWGSTLTVVTKPISEHYSIEWEDRKTKTTNTFDPIMQLNPINSIKPIN
jgi:hypothetical protein